jgi:hypothetical protein
MDFIFINIFRWSDWQKEYLADWTHFFWPTSVAIASIIFSVGASLYFPDSR